MEIKTTTEIRRINYDTYKTYSEDRWVRVDDVIESIEKIMRIMSDMDLQLDTLRRELSQSKEESK